MSKKSTDAEVEKRVNIVYEMLLSGARLRHIYQYVSDKTDWGVSTRQIDRYVQEAEKRIEEAGKYHRELELGRAIERLHNLYFKALQIQDYKCALSIQRELNSLLGLNLEDDLAERIKALEAHVAAQN